MDAWLASIYNTSGAADTDLEKTAQSMLLEKIAEAEGVDISGLSPEQLDALAADVLQDDGTQGGQVQQPQQQGVQAQQPMQAQQGMVAQAGGEAPSEETVDEDAQSIAKEAQAKFEEADFLGRVMAHSYTQELEKIASTKTAGFGMNVAKGHMRDAGRAISNKASAAGSAIKGGAEKAYGATKEHLKAHKGAYGAGAGGAAAGFAAGRMSKEAAVMVEKLAQIKAAEILTENGIDPTTGRPVQQQGVAPAAGVAGAQVATPPTQEQQVQQAVDNRAVEILKEAGYNI